MLICAFKAAAATEQAVDWGDGFWTLHGYLSDAEAYIENYFAELTEKLGKGDLVLYCPIKTIGAEYFTKLQSQSYWYTKAPVIACHL